MCGICGFLSSRPRGLDQATLDRMTDTMIHRGPDDRGTLLERFDGYVLGLGHRRLSVIDTSAAGRQPLGNEDGRVLVVYNGEIYNFQELESDLLARGHRFSTATDTEVLVHLWEEHGPDMVERLNGIFALAIWDRGTRTLMLARDHMGVKPLYYAWDGRELVFGSQLAPILESGRVAREAAPQAVYDYLALNYVPGPGTILPGVMRLQPAHRLVWRDGEVEVERYWDVRLASARVDVARDEREAAERLLATLRAAVRRQMISDVPLGMFLSGGVDSSTVLALMAEVSSRPVQAFTIDFAERGYSEVEQARRTARLYGAEHHVLRAEPDVLGLLDQLLTSADEPFADSSAIPTLMVSRLARQRVTVALAGDGGDEIFAGYQTHRAHRYASLYRRLPGVLRDRVLPWVAHHLPKSTGKIPLDFKARQFTRAAGLPVVQAHYGFKEFLPPDERLALFRDPDVRSGLLPTVRLFEAAAGQGGTSDPIDTALYLDQRIYLPDDILTKTDRASMAVSLEARVPLLDLEVVTLASTFPSRWKLKGLAGKHILKRAVAPVVDPEVLRRKKAGFNVPMAAWLRGPLRELVLDTISRNNVALVPYMDYDQVQSLVHGHLSGRAEHSRPIWAILILLLWARRHLRR